MARKRKAATKTRKKPAKKSSKKPRARRAKKPASRKKRMSTAGKVAHRKSGKKSSKKPGKKSAKAASVSLVSAHKGAPARKHDPDATMNMLALLVLLMFVLGSGFLYWQHQAGGPALASASVAMAKK